MFLNTHNIYITAVGNNCKLVQSALMIDDTNIKNAINLGFQVLKNVVCVNEAQSHFYQINPVQYLNMDHHQFPEKSEESLDQIRRGMNPGAVSSLLWKALLPYFMLQAI